MTQPACHGSDTFCAAGLLGSALATTWGALLLMVFAASAAVAAGMPILLLPAPMLAASGLALFQVSCAASQAKTSLAVRAQCCCTLQLLLDSAADALRGRCTA